MFMRYRTIKLSRTFLLASDGREALKKELVSYNKKAKSCESAIFNAMTGSFAFALQSTPERSDLFNSDLFASIINQVQITLFPSYDNSGSIGIYF